MTAHEKAGPWMIWLPTVAIASQLCLVRELLGVSGLFAIGFDVLTFVVLSLYLEPERPAVAEVRIIDSARRAGLNV